MVEKILLGVLIVMVVLLMVASYIKKKKYSTNLTEMRDQLHNGDKVLTDSGIVGEVVDSYEEEGFKYFVLKSGKGQHVGYITVHANAIYYVYGKEETSQIAATRVTKQEVKTENVEEQPKENNTQKVNKKKSK